jgi:hypothetical protein
MDAAIAEDLHLHPATVERTRRRFVDEPPTLCTSPRPKLDPTQETFLVALGVVETISDETMRKTFKKPIEALAAQIMVHRIRESGLCLAHGGRARSVC